MFRHPTAHNLEWKGVVSLINKGVEPKGGDEFSFEIGGKHHLMRKPHNKDLTSADVIELRQFFQTS